MSGSDSHPEVSLDEWLADQHRRIVTDLASTLDVEAGLRKAMIPAQHADLVADLREVLDVEAELSANVSTAPAPTRRESEEPVGAGAARGSSTKFARLVGCSDYEDRTFPKLSAPVQDIEALTRVLADPAIGDFTVDSLLNEPSRTVREQIEDFFANRKPDDLLVLYFSCHGILDSRGRLYFVASNTRNDQLESTGIAARWVKEQMNRSRSQRIVLLLDCCYSGAFAKNLERRSAAGAGEIVDQLGGRGRVVITASDKTEVARGSEFTNAVVRGLATGAADLDGDGQVSACELHQYVHDQVRQNRPDQTPTISTNKMRGQFNLAKNPQEPSPLPNELALVLTSETAWKRLSAVDDLRHLLDGDHPVGQKLTARQKLLHLRDEDTDPRMRLAATAALRRVSRRPDVPDPGPQRARWLAGIGLVVLVVLVVLGAVLPPAIRNFSGPSNLDGPPDRPIACSPSARPADGVLSLGTLFPKTGQFVYTGPPMEAGVRLAIKDINDAGGIPGIAVKLDEANQRDEGDPSTNTANQSTDALLAGGVDAIIGPGTSAVSVKVIDKVTCAGVIMFSPSTTSPVFTGYPDHGFYFRTASSDALEGPLLGRLVVKDGNSTAVLISHNDVYANPLREATEKAIRESGGQVLDSFSYESDAREYDKDVQRIKAKNPDAIILIGFTESAQILAKMTEEGIGPKNKRIYGSDSNMTSTLAGQVSRRDPGVLAGMKGILPDAGDEAFVKRLRKANPGLQDLTYAAQAYDAVVITALAAAVAGTDEPAAVAKEINGVTKDGEKCTSFTTCMTLVKDRKDIDYDGPSGTLEFTDSGEPSSITYVISEIQADGTVKPLRAEKVSS